jgi:uncharacterized MAPEG superfamily protein
MMGRRGVKMRIKGQGDFFLMPWARKRGNSLDVFAPFCLIALKAVGLSGKGIPNITCALHFSRCIYIYIYIYIYILLRRIFS